MKNHVGFIFIKIKALLSNLILSAKRFFGGVWINTTIQRWEYYMYTNCTLHKSIRDPYYDLRENNLVCTSPIRDVKAFLHHSACCYNPLGTRNPSCFCYLLLHICTYLPTGTVSKSNNVSKSGGKSLHASPDLFFGFRNSLPEKYVGT